MSVAAPSFLEIDGALGEGGGQILRTSMSLSVLTGRPIRIRNIRAGRPKPGLQKQHLVAIQAAAKVSGGSLSGGDLGSTEISFVPPPAANFEGGSFDFDIGSAGSCSLVLQTLLPILLFAKKASTVTITGGTHNGMCPPFDFLRDTFFPLLERCGARVELRLLRAGFYPAGGGIIAATVHPLDFFAVKPLSLLERGALKSSKATAAVANIPQHVADRQIAVVKYVLGWPSECVKAERLKDVTGPGNVVVLQSFFANVVETATGFGSKSMAAEEVAKHPAEEMKAYLDEDAPVGEHCADQLLLPLVLMGGGQYRATSRALTGSKHFETNVEVISLFLGKGLITYRSVSGEDAAAAGAGAGAGASSIAASATGIVGAPSLFVEVKPWTRS